MPDDLTLDYGVRARWYRRRVLRRLACLFLMLALVRCAFTSHGQRAWIYLTFLYWQHECATFQEPADRAVLVRGPPGAHIDAGLTLVQSNSYELNRYGIAGRPMPECFVRMRALQFGAYSPWLAAAPAPVFLHELRASAHRPARMVHVHTVEHAPEDCWGFQCTVEESTTRPGDRPIILSSVTCYWPDPPDRATTVHVLAGQADANDPAHFTIRLSVDGANRVLDGRLNSNDVVTLWPRTGPAPISEEQALETQKQKRQRQQ